MADQVLIVLITAGMFLAMWLKVRRNNRFRAKLIADFIADPARKERQGT